VKTLVQSLLYKETFSWPLPAAAVHGTAKNSGEGILQSGEIISERHHKPAGPLRHISTLDLKFKAGTR